MASKSPTLEMQVKFDALTASNFPGGVRPGLYFAEATQRKLVSAEKLDPPYVVYTHNGDAPTPPLGVSETWNIGLAKTIYVGGCSLDFYYTDLGDAVTAWYAAMWNGANPQLKLGLAFCTLAMELPFISFAYQVIPGRYLDGYAGFEYQNERVHVRTQEFMYRVHFDPAIIASPPPPPTP